MYITIKKNKTNKKIQFFRKLEMEISLYVMEN